MKPRHRQLAFVLASLCVVAALAAVTIQSLRLERNELRSRAIAEHEASVRLVLWRMDSMLAPILAREAATPYYFYRPFFEASRTNQPGQDALVTRASRPGAPEPSGESGASRRATKTEKADFAEIADALIPSPLLQSDSKLVNLYFEVDAQGLRSPQAPEGKFRTLAESNFISAYRIEDNRRRLTELEGVWMRSEVAQAQQHESGTAESVSPGAQAERVSVGVTPSAPEPLAAAPSAQQQQAPSDAAGSRGTPVEAASQQAGNDYAQRAQVAANSKLTQLEADRLGRQWRRAESDPSTQTSDPGDGTDVAADVAARGPEDGTAGLTDRPQADPESTAYAAPPASRGAPEVPAPAASTSSVSPGGAMLEPRDLLLGGSEPSVDDASPRIGTLSTTSDPIQGPLEPRWLAGSDEPTLVLVRQVSTPGGVVTQGLWLNWSELRGALLELAADVFPSASIDPLPGGVANLPADALNRCLATIPAELRVPDPSIPTPRVVSPVRVALGLAWLVAIAAIGASGLALRSATELADRRGQFVTAVTHELRTPLTTFCLYSQMLADGMVRDADAQAQYHATLHRESQRLTRIVESVLEYARLGKRKTHAKVEATTIAALLDASVPALRERCHGCGLELVESREGDMDGSMRVDRAMFDRIVSNLVDNACKYAAGSEPARVELHATVSASTLEVRVRDFGPGISAHEAKRIFDPFFRGSAHSDGATPGLGLGLALCKALAREMGGDLALVQFSGGDAPSAGACFRLVLPRNA